MRREDDKLLTGRGRFTSDWNFPGQLYAAVLRSPHASAELVSIDTALALTLPGVKAVLLSGDIVAAGWGTIQGGVPFEGVDGQPMRKPAYPVLADGRVCFVGEPVAFVVADSAARAQDAADAIEVEYRDLAAVASIDAALAPGAAQVHPAIAGNLAFVFARGDDGAAETALAGARFRSRLTLRSQRLISNPIEPRACVARYEAADDRFIVCTPSQGIGNMRARVAPATGLPGDRLHVVAEDVGGSFGTRSTPYPELFCCMLAAKRLGRAVKWTGLRTDSFLSDFHGRALTLTGEVGFDAEGRILAMRWDDIADLGAYASAWGAFVGTNNLAVTMGGVYRVPALAMRSRLVYTNTMPVSAYRGAGRPDIAFSIERLIDHACAEHGLDPIATRRKNFIAPSAMPYTTANGTVYDCGAFEAVMDHALTNADWAGFPARRAASEAAGRLRGMGLASYLEASGVGAAPQDQVIARFDAEGVPTLYCVAQASGQGHETTFVNLFSRESGFPAARVRYRASDPDAAIVGNGTGGSRTALGQGSAFKLLAAALIEKARPHAAEALGVHAHELTFSAGTFSANGITVTLARLAARLAGGSTHPLDCDAAGKFGVTFPNGCHIAEVEIDPETGETQLARYTAVDDIGTLLEPVLVAGQVHGGVMQGAGQVLCEQAVHDASGQLLTASFMDYALPRADLLPSQFDVAPHPVPTATNPLGAKGVGESGCSGAMPAVMNAVMNALRARGVQDLDMPVTPERIWRALHAV